jgi:hypothetical protein
MVSFTLQPIYLWGNIPWYPLDRRLDELQSQSGHGGEEKKSLYIFPSCPSEIKG